MKHKIKIESLERIQPDQMSEQKENFPISKHWIEIEFKQRKPRYSQ